MNKINYLAKSSHLHSGVDPEVVKSAVLVDYESKGYPTTIEEKPYKITVNQSVAINPEVYYLSDVIDQSKVFVGRRGGRQYASLCTPIENIRPEKRVTSSKIMIFYKYDECIKGVKVHSAFVIREDKDLLDGDYKEIYQSGKSHEELGKMTLEEVKEWYISNGFVLALDPSEWEKFKVGQTKTH
jgi:hypothetical protein